MTLTPTDATGEMVAANRARSRVSLTVADHDGAARPALPCRGGLAAPALSGGLRRRPGGGAGQHGGRHGRRRPARHRPRPRASAPRLVVTTAAAEKIYRSDGAPAALCGHCDAWRRRRADLAAAGDDPVRPRPPRPLVRHRRWRRPRRLLLAEASCSAAPPWARRSREGLFADRWRIRRGGRLIFAESVRLDGAIAERLAETAVAAGQIALATVLRGAGDEAATEAVRALAGAFRGEVGISAWNGIALARLCRARRRGAAPRSRRCCSPRSHAPACRGCG